MSGGDAVQIRALVNRVLRGAELENIAVRSVAGEQLVRRGPSARDVRAGSSINLLRVSRIEEGKLCCGRIGRGDQEAGGTRA
jgi:hypothetical protein